MGSDWWQLLIRLAWWQAWWQLVGLPAPVVTPDPHDSHSLESQQQCPAVSKSGKRWHQQCQKVARSGKQSHQQWQMHFCWLNCHESSLVKWMVVVPALLRLNSPVMSITSGIALAARINYLVEPSLKMLLIWAPLASAMIFWNQDWLSCPIKSGCIVRRHLVVFEFIWTTSAVLADLNTFHKPDWSVNSEGVL